MSKSTGLRKTETQSGEADTEVRSFSDRTAAQM